MKRDPISIPELIQSVRVFLEDTGSLMDSFGLEPLEHSRAMAEIAEFPDTRIIEASFNQGSLLLETCADHIMAFIKTVTEPIQTLAPWSIVRTVIESSSFACWLFDISINAQIRSMRSLGFRYKGLREQSKLADISEDSALFNKVINQINSLEARAIKAGIKEIRNKKGKRDSIGLRIPKISDLVNETLNMEMEYRLFSSIVHSHSWATNQVGFKKIPTLGGFKLEKDLSLESIYILTNCSIRAISKPIWYKAVLYGWDISKFEILFDSIFDQIRVAKEFRFWKN